MGHREIERVEWAHQCECPSFARKKRVRGSRALGLSYEKKFGQSLARAFSGALIGPWFVYCAEGKISYCQPDVLLLGPRHLIVFECKLGNGEEARAQLGKLYLPVLAHIWPGHQIVSIVVMKSIARETSAARVCSSLREACELAKTGYVPTLHWLGRGPL